MAAAVIPAKPPAQKLGGQNRLRLLGIGFSLMFAAIAGQAGYLSTIKGFVHVREAAAPRAESLPRPDIVDRNGQVMATDVNVSSLFADPRKIIDADEAVELLTATVPGLNSAELLKRLTMKKRGFVWLKREVGPAEREAIHNLGIPGIGFVSETKRIYPMGKLAAHVLGYVDLDSKGIAGIEKYLDDQGALYTASLADPQKHTMTPAMLSIDMRVQHALTDELRQAIVRYKAKAAGGIVMDVTTGEVLALASLPDFNPNQEKKNLSVDQMNRMTSGVFELGSVIKAVTFAMTFDYGVATLKSRYDARFPLVIGRAKISDFHAERRVLTVPEIFLHSSNIGTAKMALEVGMERHQAFLRRVGLFERLITEVPESARPLLPARWSRLSTATAAFGHGFAVQPLQGVSVVAGLLNGGMLMTPTFIKRERAEAEAMAARIVKPETSEKMRYLFRLNAQEGTARKANVVGYRVGGKTGTAEKVVNGRYSKTQRLTSFIGAFPMDAPRYALIVMIDEPLPTPETMGQATSGWNAVPAAGRLIERIAPMLGVEPRFDGDELAKLEKAEAKAMLQD